MPSPFPGMDPYLESPPLWTDFHSRFINAWCETLADSLPGDFEASLGERVYLVEQDPDSRKLIYPDVALVEKEANARRSREAAAGATMLEPVTLPVIIPEGPREAFIEILHRPDSSLVAVLELLSPANKEQPGRTEYMLKRHALLYQNVHLVELDLLMGGRRLATPQPLPKGDYHYLVHRGEERPNCQVYSWHLSQPLPRLPVPLRSPHPDLAFELAAVFTTAYDRGRFLRRVGYGGPCPAPLDEAQRSWVAGVVNK